MINNNRQEETAAYCLCGRNRPIWPPNQHGLPSGCTLCATTARLQRKESSHASEWM